mgnify:CR=1 FL=1
MHRFSRFIGSILAASTAIGLNLPALANAAVTSTVLPSLASTPSLLAPKLHTSGDSNLNAAFSQQGASTTARVNILVQGDAANTAGFSAIRPSLKQRSAGLFTGSLTAAQYALVRNTPGLRISKVQSLSLDPMGLSQGAAFTTGGKSKPVQVASTASKPVTNLIGTAPASSAGASSTVNTEIQNSVTVRDAFPGLVAARNRFGNNGSGVTVAVIDSGIDDQAAGMAGKVV